jgi:hypothetical protein
VREIPVKRRDFIRVSGLTAAGVLISPICVAAADPQAGWRWCKKCEGLWIADGGVERKGKCAAGGTHDATDSGKYTLAHNDDGAAGQSGWRWCKKCEGLWFADGGADRKGKCPAGDGHDDADSGKYTLVHNDDEAAGQQDWRWCKKCEGLWFAGGGPDRPGKCPAKDGHDATDSGQYTLAHVG